MNTKIAPKDKTSGTIPIFKELSRDFPQNFDPEKIPLKERREINAIRIMGPYSGRPGAACIESAEEIALDEIILINLLLPPTQVYFFSFLCKIAHNNINRYPKTLKSKNIQEKRRPQKQKASFFS